MITETDIIRLISDPRFERAVLATLRRALSKTVVGRDDSEEEDTPVTWGMVLITDAAKKYVLPPATIDAAIASKQVKGNGTQVDEDDLRVWLRGQDHKKPATEPAYVAPTKAIDGPVSVSFAAAALALGISEERVAESALAGTLKLVGDDRVTEASVNKFRELLPANPAPAAKEEPLVMSIRDAAALLGLDAAYTSTLAAKGHLVRTGHGKVTRSSVEAERAKRAAKPITPAPSKSEPAPKHSPAPLAATDGEPELSIQEAANRLDVSAPYASVMACEGQLTKTRRGYVTAASVESMYAYRVKKGMITQLETA